VLVDSGAIDMAIPEYVAVQLQLTDLKPHEVKLADGSAHVVRYVGPLEVGMMGRDCVSAAAVMGSQVLLGAIPMEAMDLIVHPRSQQMAPNPDNPNLPKFLAMVLTGNRVGRRRR
jgi:clan AA aspartic protease